MNRGMPSNFRTVAIRLSVLVALVAMVLTLVVPGAATQEPLGPAPFAFTSGDWSVGEIAVGRAPGGSDATVAWSGKKPGGSKKGLYTQKVDTSGDFLWEGGLTLAEPSGNVNAPSISVNADGSAVAVWQDDRSGADRIYTQKIDPTGAVKWTGNGVAVSTTGGAQQTPSLVSDGSGGAVVVWEQGSNIRAQRIDQNGNRAWGDSGVKVSTMSGNRDEPSLVSDGNGGAVVAWHEVSGSDVYAQKLDAGGNRQWGNSGKPIGQANKCQEIPTLVMTPNGDFVTVWRDNRTNDYDVYAQKVDSNGEKLWSQDSQIFKDADIFFDYPKPVRVQGNGWAASNDVTVFVKGTEKATGDKGVFGQVLDTDTGQNALRAPVQVLTPGPQDVYSLTTAPSQSGGGFVAWNSDMSGKQTLFYSRMNSDGSMPFSEPQTIPVPDSQAQWVSGVASGGGNSALIAWTNYKKGSTKGQAYGNWVGDLFPNTYYFAEGTTRPGFAPFIPIMNKSMTDDVAVTCNFLKGGDGGTNQDYGVAAVQTYQTSVPANSRGTVNVQDVLGTGDDPAHDFATEIQSTGPILAERPMYFDYQGQQTGGTDVIGVSEPGTTFYFAEGTTRPGFTSYIAVVNTSSTDNASVTANFYRGDGTTAEQALDIPPNTRSTLNVNDVLGSGDDPAYDFSAKVEATNGIPILVERPMYFIYDGQWAGGTDVVGAPQPGMTFYFAEGTTRPGFHSYFSMVNLSGTVNADVQIELYPGEGDPTTHDVTVPPNTRSTVRVNDILGTGDDPAHDFSARVHSTNGVPILAERPMYFNYQGQWDGGTDVIGAMSLDTTFYFAEGTTRPDFTTYFSIANVSTTNTAEVQVTFHPGAGETKTTTLSVAPRSRSTLDASTIMGVGDDPAYDFSATVESTNGVPILAERPMYFNYQGQWDGGTDVIGYTP